MRLQNHLLSSQGGVLVQNGPFPQVVSIPVHSRESEYQCTTTALVYDVQPANGSWYKSPRHYNLPYAVLLQFFPSMASISTHLAGALPRLLVLSTDTHSGRTLQHLPSPNLVNCPTSVSQYGLRYRLLLRDVGAVNINVIVPGVAGITTIAGVSVAGTSSPRRVSAPLVQLAPAALHKAHPHLQSSKLKVLHAHPLTHSQR